MDMKNMNINVGTEYDYDNVKTTFQNINNQNLTDDEKVPDKLIVTLYQRGKQIEMRWLIFSESFWCLTRADNPWWA